MKREKKYTEEFYDKRRRDNVLGIRQLNNWLSIQNNYNTLVLIAGKESARLRFTIRDPNDIIHHGYVRILNMPKISFPSTGLERSNKIRKLFKMAMRSAIIDILKGVRTRNKFIGIDSIPSDDMHELSMMSEAPFGTLSEEYIDAKRSIEEIHSRLKYMTISERNVVLAVIFKEEIPYKDAIKTNPLLVRRLIDEIRAIANK